MDLITIDFIIGATVEQIGQAKSQGAFYLKVLETNDQRVSTYNWFKERRNLMIGRFWMKFCIMLRISLDGRIDMS